MDARPLRMGVDLGGTKIELAVFDEAGRERLRQRAATPHTGYDAALAELAHPIVETERQGRPRARPPDRRNGAAGRRSLQRRYRHARRPLAEKRPGVQRVQHAVQWPAPE